MPLEPKLAGDQAAHKQKTNIYENKSLSQGNGSNKHYQQNHQSNKKDSSRSNTNEDSDPRSPIVSSQFARGVKKGVSDFEEVEEIGEEELQGVPRVLKSIIFY